MKTITIEIPDNLSGAVAESEDDLPRAFRLAAAIQWYSQGLISQGKGAEVTGLTRAGFLDALFHAKVPACQVTPEELEEEGDRLAAKTDRPRPPITGVPKSRATARGYLSSPMISRSLWRRCGKQYSKHDRSRVCELGRLPIPSSGTLLSGCRKSDAVGWTVIR